MSTNYDGLTRNIWPGTWSPSSASPIALDTELRGTLQSISGDVGDRLTDIFGQRIQEGMLVYLKNGYTSGLYTRTGDRYYTYKLLSGESRNPSTGAMPNYEANWSEVVFSGGGGYSGFVENPYPNVFTITNTTSAISTSTGALVVAGGVGIAQDLYVGGTIYGNLSGIGVGQSGYSGYSGAAAPAIIFDGGTPFNNYSLGPVFDAGGVT